MAQDLRWTLEYIRADFGREGSFRAQHESGGGDGGAGLLPPVSAIDAWRESLN
jgi:hypothetical protein